jgi:hypothetical protein
VAATKEALHINSNETLINALITVEFQPGAAKFKLNLFDGWQTKHGINSDAVASISSPALWNSVRFARISPGAPAANRPACLWQWV